MHDPHQPLRSDERDQLIPAAQYVRMSTDHQRYSAENQRAELQKYAKEHGQVIIRTYADEGRSGLSLDGRDGLKELIRDVEARSPGPDFKVILVYDVSRWGRFQDVDESAYYEYRCRRAGIQVEYCAEPFVNDGTPFSTLVKTLKRTMAGEYSRELSQKVFIGQCRLVEMGFRQGGPAGFGLRRMLLDGQRQPKMPLRSGEYKSLQTDRVILIPGPEQELAIVREIYEKFVYGHMSERNIADSLNILGILTDRGAQWSRGTVHQILTNEKYIGNNVYNRTSFKLKQKHVRNMPDTWVRCDGAFQGIVPLDLFKAAQQLIVARSQRMDESTMLELLRKLYDKTGALSGILIDEQEGMPSSSVYSSKFGGLLRAYALIGFHPHRDYRYIEINKALRRSRPGMVAEIVLGLENEGARVEADDQSDLLTVNGEFTLSVTLSRYLRLPGGGCRWRLRFDASLIPDVTVVIRMASNNQDILDYYLFPRIDLPLRSIRLSDEHNDINLDAYRFDSLSPLYALVKRAKLRLVA